MSSDTFYRAPGSDRWLCRGTGERSYGPDGFESNLVVRALLAGDAAVVFDLQFAMTDWTTPTPHAVTLDLSRASPGDVVTLVAVGDTGLGVDPSEFAAIPVVIGG